MATRVDAYRQVHGGDGADALRWLKSLAGLETVNSNGQVAANGKPTNRSTLDLVTTYDYPNADGELQFQVCRYRDPAGGKKSFRQRRPDGRGGWTWGLEGVERVLYNLPAVANAEVVWLAEGEKDADTLIGLGLAGTTVPGGANAKWLEQYTAALEGKVVYVLPDRDEPGAEHAAKVVKTLTGKAKQVLVLEVPAPHKDVTEWIESGGDVDGLHDLVERACIEERQAEKPFWETIPSFGKLVFRALRFLPKPLFPEGAFILIAGPPGTLKSFLMLAIAWAVSTGSSFAGRAKGEAREALYVDLENAQNVIAQRKEFLQLGPCPKLRYWGRWVERPFIGIDSPELLEYARSEKPLLIFDSLVRFHTADENSNSEMAKVMAHFVTLARAGATVVVLHHSGKDASKGFRGAAEIEAAPDVVYRVHRLDEGTIRLQQMKNRFDAERSFDLKLQRFGWEWLSGPTDFGVDNDA